MDSKNTLVAKQYSTWAYPKPIVDMASAIEAGYYEYGNPLMFLPQLWPEGRSLAGMKVLVAGCGTNQAAYYAMVLKDAEVSAIDLSVTSLQHVQYLKEKHDIGNLTLYQMSLLDVTILKQQFDYIVCTGVLHHLPDPLTGLRSLKDVLAENGMMNVMVYGKYKRAGVYMLQEAFKLCGLSQAETDVKLVKNILDRLPLDHCAQSYNKEAKDLECDAGIVDTYLHSQDRAYSIPELFEYISEGGLAFWDWEDRGNYSPLTMLKPDHPIIEKLLRLPLVQRWSVIELLTQAYGTHRFYLSHVDRAKKAKRIKFNESGWENYVPIIHPLLTVEAVGDIVQGRKTILRRAQHQIDLDNIGQRLIRHVNGKVSIKKIMQFEDEIVADQARSFFALMHDAGHLMYWLQ